MLNKKLEFFTNDKYKVLKTLYDHQIEVNNKCFSPLTQQDIADSLHFSRMKANKIMQELKAQGYTKAFKNIKGRYELTDKAKEAIQIFTMEAK